MSDLVAIVEVADKAPGKRGPISAGERMTKPKRPAPLELNLGPLPVDEINRTLGHDLDPGDVIFSSAAQTHAARRHPEDFPRCLPHVGGVVSNPDFLGDDLKNDGIELVARIPALGGGLLVALLVEPDANGNYNVLSCYPVGNAKIENRRQNGRLIIPKRK
ncbi:hypothetical protein [Brevundimonas sp.]|uniref:PBECR3 domain-containing polyvalent protein n=1 Tax=Brevundimonas sp. TaxID=1871086 RepID=UPI0034422498